jgi:hypothetical protein
MSRANWHISCCEAPLAGRRHVGPQGSRLAPYQDILYRVRQAKAVQPGR